MTRFLAAIVLAACSSVPVDRQQLAHEQPAAQLPPTPVEREPLAPSTEPSIYELELTLRDHHGTEIGLDVDRGHPTVVSMFYGSCASACPALLAYVKQVVAQTGDDTRVLLVSFDPARDTANRLRALVSERDLDARFTLASADDTTARTLAATLGIKYRATPNGEFFHNSVIVALDRDGRPLARLDGLGDSRELVAALRRP